MPSDDLRREVAAQLERRCTDGGDLHTKSPRSTWQMYADSTARLRFWRTALEELLAQRSDVDLGGRVAVVTAGPPGAGKTTMIDQHVAAELGDLSRYRRVDPDTVKDLLLNRAIADGIYEAMLRDHLADGRPLMARELSGLVHEESVRLAREMRRQCMSRGESVIIEGSLTWAPMIDEHLREVTDHGYDAIDIISVAVESDTARERVLTRWWEDRTDPSVTLGGRFVPDAVVRACWDDNGNLVSMNNAAELGRRAARQPGLRVRLAQLDEATIHPSTGPRLALIEDPSSGSAAG